MHIFLFMSKKESSVKFPVTRRSFISNTSIAATGAVILPVQKIFKNGHSLSTVWPQNATDYKFHMIGHGHIDPVWLWPWHEGVSVIHSTFRSNLERMKETKDFYFIASSAQFYQWIAENDPDMLEEIRVRIKEGRWIVVGGWWIEPDVNMPGGEALVRQGLYGQLTFEKLLGVRAKTGINADSFGHTGTLPQILKKQGMDYYMFHRPGFNEKDLPSELFWWEGPDGSKILAYRIPFSYNDDGDVAKRVNRTISQFDKLPLRNYVAFYGAGDHGGGVTKKNIRSIREVQEDKDAPKLVFSTPERYFNEVLQDKKLKIPTVKDDLQHHAVGCYTAELELKKLNRCSEEALIRAEKIASIGSLVWNSYYPKDRFTLAWEKVLFLQFHDSLPGTSIPEHSDVARGGYYHAQDTANEIMYLSGQKLEWQIEAEDPASQYVIVLNPHPWEVKSIIDYDFDWENQPSRVENESKEILNHQWSAASSEANKRRKLVVEAKLPPFGYRQLRLFAGESPVINQSVRINENILENEFYKLHFFKDGEIGVLDKETGEEVFSSKGKGCRALVMNDTSDTWGHKVKRYDDEIGAFGNAKVKILEEGAIRSSIRVITSYGDSSLVIDWSLQKGSRSIQADVKLNWHEKLKMLKFSFPVNVESPTSTYELPYGHITRENDGLENPGQRWIDVSGKQKGSVYGLTVMNDAKYGYCVQNNDMRISVARSSVYAHHEPREIDLDREYHWMDQGIHTFRMLLVPHKGTWKDSNICRIVEEFMSPPICIYQGIHGGKLPKTDSLLAIDKPNIIISAIKQAEDNNDLIIRCVESFGISTIATLDFRFRKFSWKATFHPHEIKTLRMKPNTGQIKEVNLLEEVE
jgi:alpha-mannosidase